MYSLGIEATLDAVVLSLVLAPRAVGGGKAGGGLMSGKSSIELPFTPGHKSRE